MARTKKPKDFTGDVAELQPDELNALKEVVKEFITRMKNIDDEITVLREDKKALTEEFESKLDVKTLAQALRVLKTESEVQRRGTYDTFKEILKDDFVNDLVENPE